jgi:hypothetical protein
MNFKKLAQVAKAHEAAETPAFEKGEEGGYVHDSAPTDADEQQSFVHHLDSVRYNAKHAAAHHDEEAKHAGALMNLMKKMPGFAKHARRM